MQQGGKDLVSQTCVLVPSQVQLITALLIIIVHVPTVGSIKVFLTGTDALTVFHAAPGTGWFPQINLRCGVVCSLQGNACTWRL